MTFVTHVERIKFPLIYVLPVPPHDFREDLISVQNPIWQDEAISEQDNVEQSGPLSP